MTNSNHASLPARLPDPPWTRDEFTRRRFDRIVEQELARRNLYQPVTGLPARPQLRVIQGGGQS